MEKVKVHRVTHIQMTVIEDDDGPIIMTIDHLGGMKANSVSILFEICGVSMEDSSM